MDETGETLETWTVVVDADTTSLKKELSFASSLGRQFSNSLIRAFNGLAFKGKSLGDVFRRLALDLSNLVLKAAFKPLEQGLGNLFSGLFGGVFGGGGLGASAAVPVPFAKGGVIAAPTLFPLGAGAGLAGERGAEAIMPLARTRDGRLGVVAAPAGGGAAGPSVIVNIQTSDVASFRRSESQVAAVMSRVLSSGQRNL